MPLRGSKVALTWSAGQDDVGVGHYEVFRGVVQIRSTRARSFVDPGAARWVTYRVRTVDLAGNVSARSAPIRLHVPDVLPLRRLRGLVVSGGMPIAGATVRTRVHGLRRSWTTNAMGAFLVRSIPAGIYRVKVSSRGCSSVALSVRVAASGTTARLVSLPRA
jgi:hypothetical protein